MRIAPLATLLTLTSPALAQDVFDMAFPGAEVAFEEAEGYAEMRVMTEAHDYRDAESPLETIGLEGETRRIAYEIPEGRSTLEVIRAYGQALEAAGFAEVFSCDGRAECTNFGTFGDAHAALTAPKRPHFRTAADMRYASFERVADSRRELADVMVSLGSSTHTAEVRWGSTEAEALELERLDAEGIAAALAAEGAAAIYGLEFETDSAVLLPAADAMLEQMATYLRDTDVSVLLVGHTDNVGDLGYNMDLSARRAAAARAALAERFGIPGARMEAHGVGFLAPAAPNADEDGRARNRRVEMVLR
ncbi:OmpA family protein [Jannaschia sp. LMIT008]|uniref:OmpA family protein n=1 Tax=Jannaschia maritima TaxID=3032585 RepID=UPI00281232DC|nr:OmpA family protein [Jannaschia sp. LMIT008]